MTGGFEWSGRHSISSPEGGTSAFKRNPMDTQAETIIVLVAMGLCVAVGIVYFVKTRTEGDGDQPAEKK